MFVQAEDVTVGAVRAWGETHAGLWAALRAAGRAVEVVVVGRDPVRLAAAEHVLDAWTRTPAASQPRLDEAARGAHAELTEIRAALGASAAYVVPDEDPSSLDRYAAELKRVADRGGEMGVRVCVEHFPGSTLPTAAGTIAFLREVGHPNLFLLLDIGHAQMSEENPASIISDAGPLLGYVHLDDNDGSRDLHLGLTDGILTEAALADCIAALRDIAYRGNLSLELHPGLPDPLDALGQSREIALRAMHE